jgi:hypothetical protein
MGSFADKVRENRNDFNGKLISSIFKYQDEKKVKDFSDFKDAFMNELGNKMDAGGQNSFLSEEDFIKLFNNWKTKDIITDNIGEEEARKIYGELKRGQVEIHRTDGLPSQIAVTIIKAPMISSKGYINRKGKSIVEYKRSKPIRFTEPQTKFLRALKPRLKQKKITQNQIITKYNNKYKEQQKTSSSIISKMYRL